MNEKILKNVINIRVQFSISTDFQAGKYTAFCLMSWFVLVAWKKITTKIERTFFVILQVLPASGNPSQLPTVAATPFRNCLLGTELL